MSKYINPFTDAGFKHIFGQEINKDILIDFLNALLEGEKHICDLKFLDKEQIPLSQNERGLIYDIYCTTDSGDHLIVEMQNKMQKRFRERAIYYVANDIARQGVRGSDWDYEAVPVYGIYFMNFTWPGTPKPNLKMRTDVILSDRETHEQFSDIIRLIFIQLPLMTKEEKECENDFERWIYVLKNMETFERMPFAAQRAVFDRLGSIAEIAAMPEAQRNYYEQSLKVYRDNLAIRAAALEEGEKKGVVKGERNKALEIARKMKSLGVATSVIQQSSGLSSEEIAEL